MSWKDCLFATTLLLLGVSLAQETPNAGNSTDGQLLERESSGTSGAVIAVIVLSFLVCILLLVIYHLYQTQQTGNDKANIRSTANTSRTDDVERGEITHAIDDSPVVTTADTKAAKGKLWWLATPPPPLLEEPQQTQKPSQNEVPATQAQQPPINRYEYHPSLPPPKPEPVAQTHNNTQPPKPQRLRSAGAARTVRQPIQARQHSAPHRGAPASSQQRQHAPASRPQKQRSQSKSRPAPLVVDDRLSVATTVLTPH